MKTKTVSRKSRSRRETRGSIAVIGCGNMGGAILYGLADQNQFSREDFLACDRSPDRLAQLKRELQIATTENIEDAYNFGSIVILAVKPKDLSSVMSRCRATKKKAPTTVLSIVAGATIEQLEAGLGPRATVVRAMPNLPLVVGLGMTGYYTKSDQAAALTQTLFSHVGLAQRLSTESAIDTSVALSATGAALVLTFIESMIDGGIRAGMDRKTAQLFVAQTFLGSAAMVLESGQSPATLRESIVTPGGTTVAGLTQLEKGAVRYAISQAVEAAAERARTLANSIGKVKESR